MKSPEEVKRIQAKVAETTKGVICIRDTFDENSPVPFFNGVQFMNANSVGSELTPLAWGVTNSLTDARRFHNEMDDISFYKFEKQMGSIGIRWDGTAWKYAAPIINTLNEFENREDKFFLQILYPEMGLSAEQAMNLGDYILNWAIAKENRSVILVSNFSAFLDRFGRRLSEHLLEDDYDTFAQKLRFLFIHQGDNGEIIEEIPIKYGSILMHKGYFDEMHHETRASLHAQIEFDKREKAKEEEMKKQKEQEEQNI